MIWKTFYDTCGHSCEKRIDDITKNQSEIIRCGKDECNIKNRLENSCFENSFLDLQGEVWKPIEEYPNYEVSSHGRVRSFGSHIKKTHINGGGYYVVIFQRSKKLRVHILVAKTFIDNPNNHPIINHIDGNKLNNHVSNLEWTTYSENTLHAHKTGLIDIQRKVKEIQPDGIP
jgi:hypothetical protein